MPQFPQVQFPQFPQVPIPQIRRPSVPSWKQQVTAWSSAAEQRRSQLQTAIGQIEAEIAELAGRAVQATVDAIPSSMFVLADRTRSSLEHAPAAMLAELRRRLTALQLATRADVEAQTKLARNRVSHVLKEFLEQQRGRDERLVGTMRAELHEELQSLTAAIDDELFALRAGSRAVEASLAGAAGADGEPFDDDDIDLDAFVTDDGLDLAGDVLPSALDD